jgi:hypothetical protein
MEDLSIVWIAAEPAISLQVEEVEHARRREQARHVEWGDLRQVDLQQERQRFALECFPSRIRLRWPKVYRPLCPLGEVGQTANTRPPRRGS